MYIQKDYTFRQKQELYDKIHEDSSLQGERKVEKVKTDSLEMVSHILLFKKWTWIEIQQGKVVGEEGAVLEKGRCW